MMVIGNGDAKAGSRSTASPLGNLSISSFASASTRGRSCSTCRETKARLTSVRSLVWTGGSSSSIELRLDRVESSEMRAVAVGAAAVGNACRVLPAEASVAQQPVDVVKTAESTSSRILPRKRPPWPCSQA